METGAIVILYQGKEPDKNQCNFIAGKVVDILNIGGDISVTTMNQDDISRLLVKEKYSSVGIVEVEEDSPFKTEVGNALTYVHGLFPNGITSQRAAMECVMGSDTKQRTWINALEIISKYPIKKIHEEFDTPLVTLKNLRTAYATCVELGKIEE